MKSAPQQQPRSGQYEQTEGEAITQQNPPCPHAGAHVQTIKRCPQIALSFLDLAMRIALPVFGADRPAQR